MVNKVYLPGSRATTAAGNCDEGDLTTLQRKEERLTPLPDITNLTLFGGPPPTNSLIECEHQVAWKTKAVITRRTCPPLSPYPVEQISSPDCISSGTAFFVLLNNLYCSGEILHCIVAWVAKGGQMSINVGVLVGRSGEKEFRNEAKLTLCKLALQGTDRERLNWRPTLPFPAVINANSLPHRPAYSPTINGYWSGLFFPVDTSGNSSNNSTLLERNVSAGQALNSRSVESSLTVKLEKSKGSERMLLRNIMEEDFFELTFIPELTPTLIEELKWKRVIRKSRKQVNTTTRKKSQHIKKTFIYRGSFLTFCSTLFGTYVSLIFLIQVWILISRIEIKNGTWSLSPAERMTWWFDEVENLGDELGIDKIQRDSEGSVKKSDLSEGKSLLIFDFNLLIISFLILV
uniref:Bm1329, isoform e n=1 Tax=Brugia malayi TaxID=6279 RepID=A0A1I9G2E0_BRUMA|nr:Bm1329, isoform e [Brugia malayi]